MSTTLCVGPGLRVSCLGVRGRIDRGPSPRPVLPTATCHRRPHLGASVPLPLHSPNRPCTLLAAGGNGATRTSSSPSLGARSEVTVPPAAAIATSAAAAVPTAASGVTSSTAAAHEGSKSVPSAGSGSRTSVVGSDEAKSQFVWTRHWWPLTPVEYLKPDRPNSITLLGIPMAVWRDAGGMWHVFRDRCPHRLAPLSEGRVEADGSLACSYHGWRFDGSGACRRIPQAVDAAAEAAACGSRRSCATAFPARVEFGMLWVWPDDSPDAASAAAAVASVVVSNDLRQRVERYNAYVRSKTAPPSSPTVAAVAATPSAAAPSPVVWFMRDLPYSYEILVENLADPSHLPFSHHGVSPVLSRNKGGAMPMKPSKPAAARPAANTTAAAAAAPVDAAAVAAEVATAPAEQPLHWARPDGPDFEYDFLGDIAPDATLSVHMPHNIVYTYRIKPQVQLRTELFFVPVAPGRSRFFSASRDHVPVKLSLEKLLTGDLQQAAMHLLSVYAPTVSQHMALEEILDGDSVFLNVQDELVREAEVCTDGHTTGAAANGMSAANTVGGGFWSRLYYLPTQADSVVLAARRWIEERAGGGPFGARQRQLLAGRGASVGGGVAAGAVAQMGLLLPGAAPVPGEAPDPQRRVRLLNRYEQHTRHCPYCNSRLQQLKQIAAAAAAVQTACLLGMCIAGGALGAALAAMTNAAAVGTAAAAAWSLPAAVLAGLSALWAVAGWLVAAEGSLSQIFVFKDYVHAERH